MRRRASPSSSGREISLPVGVEDADVDEDAEESVAGAGGTIGAARVRCGVSWARGFRSVLSFC